METTHEIVVGNSASMSTVADDAVELVVTSPPYPMIEMWDSTFRSMNPAIGEALDREAGRAAFERMHEVLDRTWAEVARVLRPGGIACINVGDATRSLGNGFRVYQNHARIITAFEELGFEPLPDILWRKPVNSAAKFMGSGMLPPNAYATLEHEYVLIFRNGTDRRSFEPGSERRYAAAYFWEERNEWFSDVWTSVLGTRQPLESDGLRERSGAYPFEIPYRLINMYSVYGDTVLDPFWGTGTTTLAAMVAGRNSIGYELEPRFVSAFDDRVTTVDAIASRVVQDRLESHRDFVETRRASGEEPAYTAVHYGMPVVTKQERRIRFYAIDAVEPTPDGYEVTHVPVEDRDLEDCPPAHEEGWQDMDIDDDRWSEAGSGRD